MHVPFSNYYLSRLGKDFDLLRIRGLVVAIETSRLLDCDAGRHGHLEVEGGLGAMVLETDGKFDVHVFDNFDGLNQYC